MGVLVNFDGGYARNSLHILFRLYRLEHKDPQARIRLEKHIENNYPDEFEEFKESAGLKIDNEGE